MASPRMKLLSTATVMVLGVSGYYLYSVFAAQGQGALAQAPLNIQTSIRPAFIMGVDNSGSMTSDETLFRTDDGVGHFSNGSFFDGAGDPWESGTNVPKVVSTGARADYYGAGRDPEYNRAYFNPQSTYSPWRKSDGTFEADSDPTKAAEDPRGGGTTFDFTTYRTATETWASGKVMPKGTTYYNNNKCNNAPGSGNNPQNAWVTLATDLTFSANCSTQFRYYPAVVYLSDAAAPPPGYNLTKRVLVKGAGPKGIDLWRYDYLAANFTTGGAAAAQNFANWWTYYGNRNRAVIAAMTNSMGDVTNMRVGYFQINPTPPTGNVTMYDIDVAADKLALYAKMRALAGNDTTPTRTATAYMVQQFRRTDSGAPVQLVCQKNAGMLFTDGFTNESSTNLAKVGDVDGTYPAPFGGGVASSNTIADYAMDGYIKNLRPDLATGKVPVASECSASNPDPGLDCNKNLHMNFYGVTLGARGAIYDVNAAATKNPYATFPSWGATGTTSLKPENVDDIWHASINSKGEFINAQSPSDVTDAMRRILALTGAGTTPSGSIALTGSRIGEGSLTVIPEYTAANNGTDWYSKLTAQNVTNSLSTGVGYTKLWEASDALPSTGSRNIYLAKTTAGVNPTLFVFDTASVALDDLCADSLAVCQKTGTRSITTKLGASLAEAIAYLRGDQSLEVNGATGKLRTRTTRLGDIVNSSPVVSSPTDDYGYQNLRGTTPGTYDTLDYKAYLVAKKDRDSMVYAGANDGMLHAFNGKTGTEKFAYIPATSLGHMGNLLFPYNPVDKEFQVFSHRYFVDGPVTVTDVHTGTAWKTVLVGTAGAGGRSVFALDVSGTFGTSSVLWELNDKVNVAAVKNNIGNVLGKPVVVPVKDSAGVVKWKAIFGNGYGSINNDAVLFVVDIATGTATTIKAEESTGPAVNGLGNVIALDRYVGTSTTAGSDGYVDTVYAGDQNGAVWKFDLRTNAGQTTPFFVASDPAGNRQAILGGFEAAAGPTGGVMLYFGTGSFSFANDPADKQVQTLYGVLDRLDGKVVVGRSALQQQKVLDDKADGSRTMTVNSLGLGTQGWYVDLGVVSGSTVVATGERSVGNPVIANGVIFFPTFDPNTTDSCATGGTNRLYGLNSLSGGGALSQVRVGSPTGTSPGAGTGAIKLDTPGSAPVKDIAVLTSPRAAPLEDTATEDEKKAALGAKCMMVVQAPGASKLYLPRPCGRQSWRQVR